MRRARAIRASSTRDVCILCATRQLARGPAFAPFNPASQSRQLTSSSKSSQYAAEAQVSREQQPPMRPSTQAERMRQLAMAAPPASPSPPRQQQQPRHALPQADRMRPPVQSQLNQNNRRFAPAPPTRRNDYNVRMNASPAVADTANFRSDNLRPRNEFTIRRMSPRTVDQNTEQSLESSRPPPIRRKMDQEELDALLGRDPSKPQQPQRPQRTHYTPLSKQATIKCFSCGREGHRSNECPERDSTVQSTTSNTRGWAEKSNAHGDMAIPGDVPGRSADVDRRSRRFGMDAVAGARNRYEEPRSRPREQRTTQRRPQRRMQFEEEDDEAVSKAERRKQRAEAKKAAQLRRAEPTKVYLPEYVSVANLSSMLKLRVEDFVRKLEELGFEEVQHDHILNAEHAALIAQEYNFEPVIQGQGEDGDLYPAEALPADEYAQLPTRPPVVTIMGHVDHGKTTILDYMRSSSVAAGEFGGITQHIGAFSVPLASGKKITFLDTPGHSAFETMRARGANVTDIVVLVVAADDSVMPQTVEAIKHAQSANVPIIVAINKVDKQQADPQRVKSDLGRHGIEIEEYGGDVQCVLLSGKTGQGIPELEEAITLLSEMLDHRANPESNVEGWVLEGTTKERGRVATVLVRSGTLRQGDILVAGTTWTRVRSLRNEAGALVEEVGPGLPVEVDGWREQPIAGDEVLQAADEQQAAGVSELRGAKIERERLAKDMEAINESRRLQTERRETEEAAAEAAKNGEDVAEPTAKKSSGPDITSFIVKGDVSGSVEAVIDSISSIGNNEVGARILRFGVGSPSEFDIQHAADAKGHIVNFNTPIPNNISAMAEKKGVLILDSNIIYRVVENVKALLSEKLAPKITQRVTGEVEIAAIFEIGLGGRKKMKVAGSKVRNGVVEKGTKCKVLRRDEVVFDGTLTSLKSHKKDVGEMRKDSECGIAFDGWDAFAVGDKVQCYEEKSEKRSL